jgi:serine/threonine-protein kinase PknK
MTGLRVVLAEDDVLLREGLASLLGHSGYAVVGQAGDGTRLVALARQTRPDLVVADVRMPPTHTTEGLEAARVIRQELADTAIMVLSAYAEVEHAMELLASGRGIGYLLKSRIANVDEFLEVLALMAEGRSNAGIARRLWVTEGTVEKHVSSILTKLNVHEANDDHRRVLAVITFLKAR